MIKKIKDYYIKRKLKNILDTWCNVSLPEFHQYIEVFVELVSSECRKLEDDEVLIELRNIVYEYYALEDFEVMALEGIDCDINEFWGEDVVKYLVALRMFLIRNYFFNSNVINDTNAEMYREFNSCEDAEKYLITLKKNNIERDGLKNLHYCTLSRTPIPLYSWIYSEIKENKCNIEEAYFYDEKTGSFYADKPSDLDKVTLTIIISSESQDNIDFVNKRYKDKINKLSKKAKKLEDIYKNDAS